MSTMSKIVRWLCVSYRCGMSILTTNLYQNYIKIGLAEHSQRMEICVRATRLLLFIPPHKQHEAFNVTNEHVSSVFWTGSERVEDGPLHENIAGGNRPRTILPKLRHQSNATLKTTPTKMKQKCTILVKTNGKTNHKTYSQAFPQPRIWWDYCLQGWSYGSRSQLKRLRS